VVGASTIFLVTIPLWQNFVDLMKLGLTTLAEVTHSPGLAIIIFTVLIKFLLTPLTLRTIKSQRAMQDLQPKIKALQKRYGNDRQKLSAETMRLYQEHSINPMASCLPIVFQLPIFWGLYASLRALASVPGGPFQGGFLWLPSLGHPDPYHIMPFVAAFFQLIQTRMSMPTGKYKPTDPQQQMMSQMMQFLPLTVIIFGWSFPSGLVLYWATQSVFGAVQQYFITGWGALREWLPFLPEVIRYTPPDPDAIDESKVIVTESGEARPALKQGGLWGMISRQMEKVEAQQRPATEPIEGKVVVKGSAARAESSSERSEGQRPRVAVQNSVKAQRRTAAALDADDVADTESEGDDGSASPAKATPRVVVRKSAATSNGHGGNGASAKRPPQRS